MADEIDEPLQSLWSIQVVLGNHRVVYRHNEGNSCYTNMVFWMHEHTSEIEAILERYVNDEPKIVIQNVLPDPI